MRNNHGTNVRVFPAHAGMSLPLVQGDAVVEGFPRPCGDEPDNIVVFLYFDGFSPPMRG